MKEPAHEQHGHDAFDGIADDRGDGSLQPRRTPRVGAARPAAADLADVDAIHARHPKTNWN
ncbi:MAG: hypothetical protein IPK16_22475 [Anaerolineales bacterium]|nr:hypothetical protein [Anaerolineales bacterium]